MRKRNSKLQAFRLQTRISARTRDFCESHHFVFSFNTETCCLDARLSARNAQARAANVGAHVIKLRRRLLKKPVLQITDSIASNKAKDFLLNGM